MNNTEQTLAIECKRVMKNQNEPRFQISQANHSQLISLLFWGKSNISHGKARQTCNRKGTKTMHSINSALNQTELGTYTRRNLNKNMSISNCHPTSFDAFKMESVKYIGINKDFISL
jgi:hypothetical protein